MTRLGMSDKTPLELWLDRVNLLRAKADRLDDEAQAARKEYVLALNEYPGAVLGIDVP